jgi:hypothetical protein
MVLDGYPRFANLPRLAVGAYLGRKRWAQPFQGSYYDAAFPFVIPPAPAGLWQVEK